MAKTSVLIDAKPLFGCSVNVQVLNFMLLCGVCRGKAANLQTMASGNTPGLTQEANNCTYEAIVYGENNTDVFYDMKQRFLAFKKLKYM